MVRQCLPSIMFFSACVGADEANRSASPPATTSDSTTSSGRDLDPQPAPAMVAPDVAVDPIDGPKLGICIGVNDYPGTDADLKRAVADAELVCNTLKSLGFEAHIIRDPKDLEQVKAQLNEWTKTLSNKKISASEGATFLYYAGHAFVDGDEMLAFGNATTAQAGQTGVSSLTDLITEVMRDERRSQLLVVVSDACRTYARGDALTTKNRASVSASNGGEAKFNFDAGKVIVYTTMKGQPAADSGLYAATLVDQLKRSHAEGGVSVKDAIERTNTRVSSHTSVSPEMISVDATHIWHLSPPQAPIEPPSQPPETPGNGTTSDMVAQVGSDITTGSATCRTPRPISEGKNRMHWVCVPRGDTKIGDVNMGDGDERPELMARFTEGFWMLETEVTGDQASALGLSGQSGDKPRTGVDWHIARKLCQAAGGDLPTEFQWEHAARGGGREGSWGAGEGGMVITEDNLGEYTWYASNSDAVQAVRTRKPNAYGLYDLWGNVWEWTLDGYDSSPYAKWAKHATTKLETFPLLVNPGFVATIDKSPPFSHVRRGGSFDAVSRNVRSGTRNWFRPTIVFSLLGFRCVSGSSPLAVDL